MIPGFLTGTAAKLIGGAILIAVLTGGYFYWRGVQRDVGREEVRAEYRRALDEQRAKDKVTSDRLIAGKDAYIRELESTAAPVVEVVKYVSRSTCPADLALKSAADFVRQQLGSSRPPTGR